MKKKVQIIKLDYAGKEVWRYDGIVLERGKHFIIVKARFNRADLPFHGIVFKQNDIFIELFFENQWFNVFEIHDRDKHTIKGWYCNITYPATLQEKQISYRDLALDLLVYADGSQLVLDENEFATLSINNQDKLTALNTLTQVQRIFTEGFRHYAGNGDGGISVDGFLRRVVLASSKSADS